MSGQKLCDGLTLEKCNDPAVRKLGGGKCADICYNKVGCSSNPKYKYPGQTKDTWGVCYDNIKAAKAGSGPANSWCVNTKSSTWTSNVNSIKAQVTKDLSGFRCDSIKSDAITVTVPTGTASTSENIIGEVYLKTNGFAGFKKGQQIIVKGMGEAMVVEIVDNKKSAALFLPWGKDGKLVQDGDTFSPQQLTASRACTKDSDCPVGYCGLDKYCTNYKKVGESCKSSQQCGSSQRLCTVNRGKKMCVEECNSSEDPRDPHGKCLWNSGNIPLGKTCTKSEDCDSGNCKNGKCGPFFQKFTPSSTSGCGTVPVTDSSCDAACNNVQPGSVFRADLGGCVKPQCAKPNVVSCAYKKYRDMCPTECEAVYPAVSTTFDWCLTVLNDVINNQSKYFKKSSDKYGFMRVKGSTHYMVKRSDDKIEFILYDMSKNQNTDVLSMNLVDGEPNQQWLDTWTNLYETDSPQCRMVYIPAQQDTCASILDTVNKNYDKYFAKSTDTSFYANAFGSILKFELVEDSKTFKYKMSYNFSDKSGGIKFGSVCYATVSTPVMTEGSTCNDIVKYVIQNNDKLNPNKKAWVYATANDQFFLIESQDQNLIAGKKGYKVNVRVFSGNTWQKLKQSSKVDKCEAALIQPKCTPANSSKAFPYPSKIPLDYGVCYNKPNSTAAGSWCVQDDSPAMTYNKDYFVGPKGAFKRLVGYPCSVVNEDAEAVTIPSSTPDNSRDILAQVDKQGGFKGKVKGDQVIVLGMGEAMMAKLVSDTSAAMFLPWGSDSGALAQDGAEYTIKN
jgi:hypothetical protein